MPSEHEEIDFGDADAGNGGFDVDADAPPDAHEDDGAERDFSAENEDRQEKCASSYDSFKQMVEGITGTVARPEGQ